MKGTKVQTLSTHTGAYSVYVIVYSEMVNNQHSASHKGRQSWSYRIIIHLICATALDVHRVEGNYKMYLG